VLASGVLARRDPDATVDDVRIQVLDLLIGPNQQAEAVALNGSSTHLVLNGSGQITFAEGGAVVQRPFQPGSTWTLASGQSFQITNRGEQHVDIRVRIVRAAP
jgi:hypothetical protein